jgi:hypothetical protein
MMGDFFDLAPEQQNVVLIDAATRRKAEEIIKSCGYCNPEHAEIAGILTRAPLRLPGKQLSTSTP